MEAGAAHPTLLFLEAAVRHRAAVVYVGKVCKPHLQTLMPAKQTWTTQGLGSAQQDKVSCTSLKPGSGSAIMRGWTGIAHTTQEALLQGLERI